METYACSSKVEMKSVDNGEITEKVYIAVKEDFWEGKPTLLWVIEKLNKDKKMKMVFIHVYVPGDMTSTMKSQFPANKEGHVLKHYSKKRETVHEKLNAFTDACTKLKVQSEILVIEAEDIVEGLMELVSLHGIAMLVMGAASDKHFTKKMKLLKSKTAIRVKQLADPSCTIWFVCDGTLICTREAFLGKPLSEAPTGILSSLNSFPFKAAMSGSRLDSGVSSASDLSDDSYSSIISDDPGTVRNSSSVSDAKLEQRNEPRVQPQNEHYNGGLNMSFPKNVLARPWPSATSATAQGSQGRSATSSQGRGACSQGRSATSGQGRGHAVKARFDPALDIKLDSGLYAWNWKHEAHRELLKRRKAEKDAEEAFRRANIAENNYANEASIRKEVEELLAKQQMEAKKIISQHDEVTKQLQNANKKLLELKIHIDDYDYALRNSEEKSLTAQQLYEALKVEHEKLQQQRDATLKEVEDLRRCQVANKSGTVTNFSEFSFPEIELATHSFSDSLKIGEGGYGSVYKGFLRNTTVAIKVLNCEGMQGRSEFHQEVKILSMVRHPNLITLIGVCSENFALIYEYLPNGSLDDRLDCKDNTLPLTWQTRSRISTEICSALIFLHSSKPYPIVHGDLKPENILLDANLTSKLGDFGICRLLTQSTTTSRTPYHRTTVPKGTYAYMDVEYVRSGELTPQSDVYSFGIILLRLLTGKAAIGIVKEVKDALDRNTLHEILDSGAGDWPFLQAKQLARLGLRCCGIDRRKRPHLVEDVWRVLLSVMNVASKSVSSLSVDPVLDDDVPNHFVCPIFQEIMTDPHMASDGFTYEAEALRGWIESGHNTSPMTNLKLANSDHIPNRALRSAIQEWLQLQHPQL